MQAYKFLDASGRSPFTATRWEPDRWVEAEGVDPCREGVHACRAADLSWWLGEALWVVEIDDAVETRHKVVGRRGRLVRPVEGYGEAAHELGEVGAWRSRDRAVAAIAADRGWSGRRRRASLAAQLAGCATVSELADLAPAVAATGSLSAFASDAAGLACEAAHFAVHGQAAQAPFVAACAAGHAAAGDGGTRADYEAGYEAERRSQSRWLTARLSLEA